MYEYEFDGGKMYRNELDILRRKMYEFCDELPNSADESEIKRLSEEFYRVCNLDIPHEYVEFLRQCDGVEFNGCIIYGSNNIIESQLDYDYVAENYVIFAEYDIGWFCMEKSSGKYCELDKPSARELQIFDTLEAMLKRVLLLSVEL